MDESARNRQAERERIKREHNLGVRRRKSAKLSIPKEKRLAGKCLVCGNRAHACICSGHMSQEAQKRFYESRK